jgi:hypothetical protein
MDIARVIDRSEQTHKKKKQPQGVNRKENSLKEV